jgi:outer membrane biosynthesis protein TonB
MLVRGTLGRWAAAKTSARDLPQLARFLHRTLTARNAAHLPAARALTRAYRAVLGARRSYATTTTATKPTATVKKAVKAQAAAKAVPKKTAATKTAKKPATKTTSSKAKPKAAPKAKKKKAAPKKPAPKKRVKKVLTPEQQEKLKVRELRKRALREPVNPGIVSARNAYIGEKLKGIGGNAPTKLGEAGKGFKELTPAELEVSR